MNLSSSSAEMLTNGEWVELLRSVIGPSYSVSFIIHIPTRKVRNMDGRRLYLHNQTVELIDDLRPYVGDRQFKRLIKLIYSSADKWCASSSSRLLTAVRIPREGSTVTYTARFIPIRYDELRKPIMIAVSLSETNIWDELAQVNVAIGTQANTIQRWSFDGNAWRISDCFGINARELEGFRCAAAGFNISDIAHRLSIGESAVKKSRRRVLDKLSVGSLSAGIQFLQLLGMI